MTVMELTPGAAVTILCGPSTLTGKALRVYGPADHLHVLIEVDTVHTGTGETMDIDSVRQRVAKIV